MSDAVKEQISACLDARLPAAQLELLVKRVARDGELRATMWRYGLIGEVLRSDRPAAARGFAADVMAAVEAEPLLRSSIRRSVLPVKYRIRPAIGMAAAAALAGVVLLSAQQLRWMSGSTVTESARLAKPAGRLEQAGVPADVPGSTSADAAAQATLALSALEQAAPAIEAARPGAAPSTAAETGLAHSSGAAPMVLAANQRQAGAESPASLPDDYAVAAAGNGSQRSFIPAMRLTNYVVTHSEYSSPLSRRSVLTGVLADDPDSQIRYPQASWDGDEIEAFTVMPARAP